MPGMSTWGKVMAFLIFFLPFFSAEVCGALNVTVCPGPVVDYLEGENATLLCHVSQKELGHRGGLGVPGAPGTASGVT